MEQVDILGVGVNSCTLAEAVEFISGLAVSGGSGQVVTANAEIFWQAWREKALARVLEQAVLVTADGVGVLWAAKRLGHPLPERVAGIDLVRALAHRSARDHWRLFFYGGAPGVAETAAYRLEREYPGITVAGCAHGYQTEEGDRKVREAIGLSHPHILLVAMGAPKQDFWIARHLSGLGVPVAIGVGGSLDVIAGKAKRAPAWVRRLSLEWLYRLAREPGRWRRQTALPAFVWRILRAGRR